jgi:hypothetical protein
MNNTVIIIISNNKNSIDISIKYYKLSNDNVKFIICSSNCYEMKKHCIENGVNKNDIITTFNNSVKNINSLVFSDPIYNSIVFCKKILEKIYDFNTLKINFCISKKEVRRTELYFKFIFFKINIKNIIFLYFNEIITELDLKLEEDAINNFYKNKIKL